MPKPIVKKVAKVTRQHVSLKLDKSILALIDEVSANEGRTRSNQIEQWLKQYVKENM